MHAEDVVYSPLPGAPPRKPAGAGSLQDGTLLVRVVPGDGFVLAEAPEIPCPGPKAFWGLGLEVSAILSRG